MKTQNQGEPIPMTPDHSLWDEFIDRLNGPEGCNFELKESGAERSLTWECDAAGAFPISRQILGDWGFSLEEIEESLSYFQEHGGYCDCEMVLKVHSFVWRLSASSMIQD
jgi:Protein of unknown function (DUF2695)